jgi:hypothetical protein
MEEAIAAAMDQGEDGGDSVAATERAANKWIDALEAMRSPRPSPIEVSLRSADAKEFSAATAKASEREPAPQVSYPKKPTNKPLGMPPQSSSSSSSAPPLRKGAAAAVHECDHPSHGGGGGGTHGGHGHGHGGGNDHGLGGGGGDGGGGGGIGGSDDGPQLVRDVPNLTFAQARLTMRRRAAEFLRTNIAKIRTDYCFYHDEHKGVGGPMGCYRAAEFQADRLPMPDAKKRATGRVTMMPKVGVAKLAADALVTTWMLPASWAAVRAERQVYPEYLERVGAAMNPRDVCLWFQETLTQIDRTETIQLYVPGGMSLLRSTKVRSDVIASAWTQLLVNAKL